MNSHRIETILTENGKLILQDLPFKKGDAVEVIILDHSQQQGETPTLDSNSNPYPLHGKQPYRYDDPTEPVAVEDWEVLQ